MATLADSFLADLDELSDNVLDDENFDAEQEDVGDLADTLDNVSKLQKSRRYIDVMQKVEDALIDVTNKGNTVDLDDDDPEFQLIVACNTLLIDIENEIFIIHNFIRDRYRFKFRELDSLVPHLIDYARVVKKIGNEMDVARVDLAGLLISVNIMVVCITASTTNGKPLPEDVLQKTLEACDRAIALDSAKKKVFDFLESRMGNIAPNLSAVVGSAVSAKLIGAAGCLSKLANMPSDNIQHLGNKRKNLAGFSSKFCRAGGYIEQSKIIRNTSSSLRKEACGWLADKSILAARMDSNRGKPTGEYGRSLKEEILKKIEKSQEQPPAR
ncbi:U4/U6 small nuclear ribonucleoprotein Prp31 homolog [Nicotiana tomentosiformis]|uniref:U4/U6 small nuclear ribonucleoprotein Prp31 homolog n=1 Tax=Nicotiana tomentosiformis TaxID=4098 RepID=UPI000878721A|nr:U4/U6 small nuclear ribonucleoprotein Prp31 homolog [Nicotiana tomentosiformis]